MAPPATLVAWTELGVPLEHVLSCTSLLLSTAEQSRSWTFLESYKARATCCFMSEYAKDWEAAEMLVPGQFLVHEGPDRWVQCVITNGEVGPAQLEKAYTVFVRTAFSLAKSEEEGNLNVHCVESKHLGPMCAAALARTAGSLKPMAEILKIIAARRDPGMMRIVWEGYHLGEESFYRTRRQENHQIKDLSDALRALRPESSHAPIPTPILFMLFMLYTICCSLAPLVFPFYSPHA